MEGKVAGLKIWRRRVVARVGDVMGAVCLADLRTTGVDGAILLFLRRWGAKLDAVN